MNDKLARVLQDAFSACFAGMAVVVGVHATGKWSADLAAFVAALLMIVAKAINPSDNSYGLTQAQAQEQRPRPLL